MSDELNSRLDRFERKLDQVADALLTLVRVEERQVHHENSSAQLRKWVEDHEQRISAVEKVTIVNRVKLGFGERVWWSGFSLVLATAAWFVKG